MFIIAQVDSIMEGGSIRIEEEFTAYAKQAMLPGVKRLA